MQPTSPKVNLEFAGRHPSAKNLSEAVATRDSGKTCQRRLRSITRSPSDVIRRENKAKERWAKVHSHVGFSGISRETFSKEILTILDPF